MDAKIDDMISSGIIPVKIVIQGKADKGRRPGSGAFKAGRGDFLKGQPVQTDMGIFFNFGHIVKNKR